MAKVLLAHGASRSATDKAGRSVMYYAARQGAGNLFHDPGSYAGKTILGETLLHAALAGGDLKLSRELIGKGLGVKEATADGRTLMHYARGQLAVLMLLDLGLDVNARDVGGRTPLHAVVIDIVEGARRGRPVPGADSSEYETAQALIAAGADIAAADQGGVTPAGWYASKPPRAVPARKGAKPQAPPPDPWITLLAPR